MTSEAITGLPGEKESNNMRSRTAPMPPRERSVPWWLGLVVGIVAMVIGLLLILSPEMTATYLFWILGIAAIIGGAVVLISIAFRPAAWGWKVLAGIIAIVLGLGLIAQPLFSAYLVAAIAVWILGSALIVVGLVLMVPAFSGIGWWYGLLGAAAILIGALLILSSVVAPVRAPWVFGVVAIIAGILAVVATLQSRSRPQSGAITTISG
jgi:uncharacterized membrane protein HdeD (DUF308 family)